jgi:hypothetical protein
MPNSFTPCGRATAKTACGWRRRRSAFTYGVGLRLPHAMRTARINMSRLDRGLKLVTFETKYESPKGD